MISSWLLSWRLRINLRMSASPLLVAIGPEWEGWDESEVYSVAQETGHEDCESTYPE